MFSYLSHALRKPVSHYLQIVLVAFLGISACFSASVAAGDILYTNIRGYHYSADVPERIPVKARLAAAPRSGYWVQFGAMLIGEDGKIKQLFSRTPTDEQQQAFGEPLQIIDGHGNTVLPGLIDAHGHVLSLGQRLQRVDLVGTVSVQDAQQRLLDYIDNNQSEKWLLGRGWNQVLWPEKEFPTAAMLDEIEAEKPVFLNRIDGHAGWANTAALRLANISALSKDPKGGQILRHDSGQPTGVLIDSAMDLVANVIPKPSEESILQALEFAQNELKSMGITSVHDAGVEGELAELYRKLALNKQLSVRIYGMVAGAGEHLDAVGTPWPDTADDMLAMRSVKLYADGALGSRGAALLSPYSDEPGNTGLLFSPFDELQLQVERAAKLGFQVSVHAIGDAANRQVLDIFAALPATRHDLRHRVEHAQIIELNDLQRFANLKIIASMQPTHATSDMNMAEDRIGKQRVKGAYAWRRLLDSGAIIAAGSDFPVELSNPFHGLYSAVARKDHDGNPPQGWYADQAMTRGEALRAFTVDAAYAAHQEKMLGNLHPGQWADFIVIDKDFFTVPEEQIHSIKVLQTWLAGQCIYEQGAPE